MLQSDKVREFVHSVMEELCSMWEGLKTVHGKRKHSQSQGSVERANRVIQDMLTTWLQSNYTTRWAKRLSFVPECVKKVLRVHCMRQCFASKWKWTWKLETFLMKSLTKFKLKRNSKKSFLQYMTKMKQRCKNKITTFNI